MGELGRAIGAGIPFQFNGEDLILKPPDWNDIALGEREMVKDRPDFIGMVKQHIKDLPVEIAEKLLNQAYQDAKKALEPSPDEVMTWMLSTRAGVAFTLWRMIDKPYPGRYTRKEVEQHVLGMNDEDFEQMSQQQSAAAGADELGNSTGPTLPLSRRERRKRARRDQARAAVESSVGGESSGT